MRRVAYGQMEAIGCSSLDDTECPPRPSLPAIALMAFGLWASCALSMSLLIDAGKPLLAVVVVAGLIAAFGALLAAWRLSRAAQILCAVAGVALGISLGCAHLLWWHAQIDLADGSAGLWSCRAVYDGSEGDFGQSVYADISSDAGSYRARVYLPKEAPEVRYGDRFTVRGSLCAPKESQRSMYLTHDAQASLKVSSWESSSELSVIDLVCRIRNATIDYLEPFAVCDGGVTPALVCAWRGDLDEDLYRSFQVCGLAHIVAVSGAHLSLVAAFLGSVTRRLRAPRWLASSVQIVFILAYLVFTAFPLSALRACVMTTVALACSSFKRRPAALNALSICVLGVISIDPSASLSVSFALSTLSTLGIIVFGSLFSSWLKSIAGFLPAFAIDAAALTLASSVTATPFSAALFSQLPVISVLANIVVAPLFAPVCAAGLLASMCALAVPSTSLVVGNACSWASWLLGAVVSRLSSVPYASIPVCLSETGALAISLALCAALWLAWPHPRRISWRGACLVFVPVALCLVVLSVAAPRATELVMLDVGQGDAIVLRSGGKTMLIDTGNQDGLLREALAREKVSKIDVVLITHPDDDHMGSLASLRGVVGVSNVVVAKDVLSCACTSCMRLRNDAAGLVGEAAIEPLEVGDTLRFGSWEARCIWPHAFSDEGGNADSICLLASADTDDDGEGEGSVLLVGDAEHDQLSELIDEGVISTIDIYKVGHHGSKNALTEEQAEKLSPRLSLISVGVNNRYGHPADKTIAALESCGSSILRTDLNGDIVCDFSTQGISVRTVR